MVVTLTHFEENQAHPSSGSRAVRAVWRKIGEDDCAGLAAKMAYYFVMALFPCLIILAALASSLPLTPGGHSAVASIARYLPASSRPLLIHTFSHLQQGRSGFLYFGIVSAAWAASTGILALMEALNNVYDVREQRGYVIRRLLALGMLVVLCVCFLVALTLQVCEGTLASSLQSYLHTGGPLYVVFRAAAWVISILLLIIGVSLVESVLPNAHRSWRWISAGGVFFVAVSIPAAVGFRYYVRHFTHYATTYGILGGFFVLMLWIYMESLILLISAEINFALSRREVEKRTAAPTAA